MLLIDEIDKADSSVPNGIRPTTTGPMVTPTARGYHLAVARAAPKLTANAERISEIVALVMSGRVRIPPFQRGLKWEAVDVIALFESVYLGYPVGSLIFYRSPAPADLLRVGPLQIAAHEDDQALWVVDGQQRLTALAASLGRPDPIPTAPIDPFVVYFDAEEQAFCSPSGKQKIPTTWVPLIALLDPSRTTEWVFHWKHGRDEMLRRTVFDAGTRIREYTIPGYTVDTSDEELLRKIFHRVNSYGKRLEWGEVHDALFGQRGRVSPSTVQELADELSRMGMGRPEESQVLQCIVAYEGLDVTRSFEEHYRRNPKFLEGTVSVGLPTLRRVFDFLRSHASIAHLRLLPWSAPLTILTRLFRRHPEPNPRSLQLLRRWLWRSMFAVGSYDEATFQRRGVSDIDDDEEASVQRLLGFLPKNPRPFELPDRFDARAADSRIVLLALASLGPRDPATGSVLELVQTIESVDPFRKIVGDDVPGARNPANRMLMSGRGFAEDELHPFVLAPNLDHEVLKSHAISPDAARALAAGDHEGFLAERKKTLESSIVDLGNRMAEWSSNDRPSIEYLLAQAESEHAPAV